MKNKYIIKLYHYYLRKKYDNDKIVGIKESEKMLEKFDVLVLSGGLTDDDYKELVEEINKNEED
mgnify:FL=1